jgi:DNA segregation ATPase FtsK/SpoIIIE-like protein
LYVNPSRKIYIADFGGVDFRHLNKLNLNIEIVDELEACRDLVDKIHHEEYEKRVNLMKEYDVSDLKLLQREGVDIDRTLWIIDEAADIAEASSKLRDSIEKRLKEYARKGRKSSIHVLYCTQRPSATVITSQVTDQCEEKTVFRVSPDASQLILHDAVAGDIPKGAPGRAWLDGYAGRMFINVPKMKKPEGSIIPIADTLWHYFTSR